MTIISRPVTKEYEEGWERIFQKEDTDAVKEGKQ